MMSPLVRCGAVVAFLVSVVACENPPPYFSPSRISQPPPASSPAPTPAPTPPRTPITFPPLSGPSRTFTFDRAAYPVSNHTKQSRWVLFDNGAFMLEYPTTIPAGRLPGQYRVTDSVLTFLFEWSEGRSVDEAWDDATGILQGDTLTIEFELNMQMADYQNAIYVLSH
jgi:hypothetical protein